MTAESRLPGILGFVRPFLIATFELSGLFGIFATAVSITLNTIMFGRWGLDFLSIATPTDIFMSGLLSGLTTIISVTIVALSYLVTSALNRLIDTIPIKRRSWIKIVLLIFGFLLLGYFCLWISTERNFLFEVVSIGVAIGVIGAFHHKAPAFTANLQLIAWVATIILLVVINGRQLWKDAATSSTDLFAVSKTAACNGNMEVVWIGDKSIVGLCYEVGPSYVVIPRDGAALVDRERAEAIELGDIKVDDQPVTEKPDWYAHLFEGAEVGAVEYLNFASIKNAGRNRKVGEIIRVYPRPAADGIYYTRADVAVTCGKHIEPSWNGVVHYDRDGMLVADPRGPENLKKISAFRISQDIVEAVCFNQKLPFSRVTAPILQDAPQRLNSNRATLLRMRTYRPSNGRRAYWRDGIRQH